MSSIKGNVADLYWKGPGPEMEVVRFQADDRLSGMSQVHVLLESLEPVTDFQPFLGSGAKVLVMVGETLAQERYFSGIVTSMKQVHSDHGSWDPATTKRYRYEVALHPRLWLLLKVFRSRVYQKKTAKDIVSALLSENKVKAEWRISRQPEVRIYTLQYQESNYNFVNRLLEDEGIYYFYDHKQESLVFCDNPSQHKPCVPFHDIEYGEGQRNVHGRSKQEYINSAIYSEQIGSGSFVTNDYNYEKSQTPLLAKVPQARPPADSNLEIYHHNTTHTQLSQGEQYATRFGEGEVAGLKSLEGVSSSRSISCGSNFTMKKHYVKSLNDQYLVRDTSVVAEQGSYQVSFGAIPARTLYRPPFRTPVPRVDGIQTATVTGPSGEEVFLDAMGRCKLQFHWDREGSKDDNASMWVRVANNYAGADYGVQFIPRIGNEVLVQFIDGNPDHPVVIGRVYNDVATAPLGPDEKWHNIIKTPRDNHILFDDKQDKERLDLRAQKDMNTQVVNNKTKSVGANESTSIEGDKSLKIKGSFSQEIKKKKESKIESDYEVTSEKGGIHMTADKEGLSFTSGNSKVEIKPNEIHLKMGSNFIKIDAKGVTIRGTLVQIN